MIIIKAPVTGSVWMHSVSLEQEVFAGNQLMLMESMKMEIPIETPVNGKVFWLAAVGTTVEQDDPVAKVG